MNGLACPSCGKHMLRTVESRKADGTVRRRRECVKCGERFTTIEVIEAVNRPQGKEKKR